MSEFITVQVPINTGKRATRVQLPGDCVLTDVKYGGLITKQYANTAIRGKPVAALTFRLVEKSEPIARCFRIATPAMVDEFDLANYNSRSLGVIASFEHDGQLFEVIEMTPYDAHSRVSDIQTMQLKRGLNKLTFKNKLVVRVNKIVDVGYGQWELRYQSKRKHGGMVGYVFIGDEEVDAVPAVLLEQDTLGKGLKVWLSANLCV